jgi:hypothetical protein
VENTEAFTLLFNSLKDDMQKGFELISQSINEMKKDIDNHIEKTNNVNTEIGILQNEYKNLKSDFEEDKKKNNIQHNEFYANFRNVDKFIYKITGGFLLVGILISILLKVLKYI